MAYQKLRLVLTQIEMISAICFRKHMIHPSTQTQGRSLAPTTRYGEPAFFEVILNKLISSNMSTNSYLRSSITLLDQSPMLVFHVRVVLACCGSLILDHNGHSTLEQIFFLWNISFNCFSILNCTYQLQT